MVYLIKSHIWIWEQEQWSIAVYLLVPITLSIVCIKISDFLSLDSIEYVQTIEVGEESYMAVYLGYFFVGTSISDGDWITLICVFGMIFLFVFCSQAQYFNPIFLLLGYKFYGVTKENGVKIFVEFLKKAHTGNGRIYNFWIYEELTILLLSIRGVRPWITYSQE